MSYRGPSASRRDAPIFSFLGLRGALLPRFRRIANHEACVGPPGGVPLAALEFKKVTVGNRLFVGNLSFSTTQASLEAAFAVAGEVRETAIPVDRETGQPRGFAFVTMADAQAAANAISQLNGSTLDGREIRVDEAQERAPRGDGGGGFRGGGGGGGGFRGGGGGGGGGDRRGGGGSRRGSRDRF
jgi:cold-inducible RNA-binding protein